MLLYEQALERVIDAVRPARAEVVPLRESRGRVLAEDLSAREDNPLFGNSAMDGYAVRSEDLRGAGEDNPVSLRLAGESAAGAPDRSAVEPGSAVRIFTGAPIPEGADSVVMQEVVELSGGIALFREPAPPGRHVRERGSDIRSGAPLFPRGTVLAPLRLAILAAQGMTRVRVMKRPKVSILSTGDELVPMDAELSFGQVRNCSGFCLTAAVLEAGGDPGDCGAAPDDPAAIERAISAAAKGADILLVGGGVSVGDYDHTGRVLEALGMKKDFWKVAVKPGKPLLFGRLGDCLVFGLPGNPVSSWVSFELFVRPALEAMLGRQRTASFPERGRVLNGFSACKARRQLLFCRASEEDGRFALDIIKPQSSGALAVAARANAVAFPPGEGRAVKAGERIPFRWIER